MKWILIVLALLAALVAILFVLGITAPKEHVATVTRSFAAPDSTIFRIASDFEHVPSWFTEVRSVRRIADVDGQAAYRENYGGFEVTNVVRQLTPNSRIVREILPEGSFSGRWTMELFPAGDSTRVVLTEYGVVENAFFRAMMRFGDNTKTMKGYLEALGKRLT
jgi:uncharacterized protein YndB with AHSA1/START domain